MRTAILFLAATSALSQQAFSQQSTSLDAIASRMQDYARGITETRFDVACKITRYDPAGKVVKVTNTTHSLEFTKGSFKTGSEDEPAVWSATWVVHGGRTVVGLELHADAGALFPVFVFGPQKRKDVALNASTASDGHAVNVAFEPRHPCQSFKPMKKGFGLDNVSCGKGQIFIDDSAAIPLRSSFEGAGFPVSSGAESMNSFHADSEFAAVSLPGGARPFLFPKKVTADFGFSEGKVNLSCDYTPHPAKPSKKK